MTWYWILRMCLWLGQSNTNDSFSPIDIPCSTASSCQTGNKTCTENSADNSFNPVSHIFFLHSSNLPANELFLTVLFTCHICAVVCVSSYIYKLSITCIVLDCKQFLVYFFTIFILDFCVFFTKLVIFSFSYWPFPAFSLPFM